MSTNTEKPSTKAEMKKQGVVNTSKKSMPNKILNKNQYDVAKKLLIETGENKVDKETSSINNSKQSSGVKINEQSKKPDDKKEPKKEEKKKPIIQKPKIKKTEAVVNVYARPISTKYSIAICRFIKGKKIGDAIRDLEDVLKQKKAIPMNNLEIPHKKGKGMSAGRYPKKATEYFINLLKTLVANTNFNDMDDPVISEAIANLASRPYGRFGRHRKKRTHLKIVAKEKKLIKKLNKKKAKKK